LFGWLGKQAFAEKARFALDMQYCNVIKTSTGVASKKINLIYLQGKFRHMPIW
jgi:hypothetical protein